MTKINLINSKEFSDREHLTFKIHEDRIEKAIEKMIRKHKGLSKEDVVKSMFVTREMKSDMYLVQVELEPGITD